MQQTIEVWLEDKPGALMRVAGILTAKGCNIDALSVRPDRLMKGVSRMVIVADVERHLHARILAQMNRLVNVLSAMDFAAAPSGRKSVRRWPPESQRETEATWC